MSGGFKGRSRGAIAASRSAAVSTGSTVKGTELASATKTGTADFVLIFLDCPIPTLIASLSHRDLAMKQSWHHGSGNLPTS